MPKRSTIKKPGKTAATVSRKVSPAESEVPFYKRYLSKLPSGTYLLLIALGIVVLLFVLGNKFLVVAWVDNKPITRFEFYNSLDKRYGKDLKEELIVERLINNEAAAKKITVTGAEIVSEIKKLEEQQGGADKLDQIMQIQGITREDLKKLVRLQLLRQKLFGANVAVSNDEVEKYIEENKQNFASPSAQMDSKTKEAIRDQLKQQKINEAFNKWLTNNLHASRVNRL